MAISSPLLEDLSIDGARGVLINITGGPDMTLYEVNEASTLIQEAAHEDANIIFGAVIDDQMPEGEMRVTVIATGLDDGTGRRGRDREPAEDAGNVTPLRRERRRSTGPCPPARGAARADLAPQAQRVAGSSAKPSHASRPRPTRSASGDGLAVALRGRARRADLPAPAQRRGRGGGGGAGYPGLPAPFGGLTRPRGLPKPDARVRKRPGVSRVAARFAGSLRRTCGPSGGSGPGRPAPARRCGCEAPAPRPRSLPLFPTVRFSFRADARSA